MAGRHLHWLDLGDAALPYVALGDPQGRPVVALPGLSDGLAPISEARVRDALPDPGAQLAGYRLLLLSHRHPVEPDTTTAALAADVRRFLEEVVAAPAVLTGHSMGGMVAQHVAATAGGLVDRLILSATVAAADERLRRRVARWDAHVAARRWRRFFREAIRASFTGSAQLRRRLALRLGPVPAADHLVDRHLALSAACRSHDATAVLEAIRAPTLVLAGERDPLAPPDRGRELARAIADARFEVLAGLAHGFPEQAPDRYLRRVRRFVEHGR